MVGSSVRPSGRAVPISCLRLRTSPIGDLDDDGIDDRRDRNTGGPNEDNGAVSTCGTGRSPTTGMRPATPTSRSMAGANRGSATRLRTSPSRTPRGDGAQRSVHGTAMTGVLYAGPLPRDVDPVTHRTSRIGGPVVHQLGTCWGSWLVGDLSRGRQSPSSRCSRYSPGRGSTSTSVLGPDRRRVHRLS